MHYSDDEVVQDVVSSLKEENKNIIDKYLQIGKEVLASEASALNNLTSLLDNSFAKACNILMHTKGRIIVTGVGKSGHIGKKIAATFASTGSPAFFVHSGEASHGDMGMITDSDTVVAISNSGTTKEVIKLLPLIKDLNVPLVSITNNPKSKLAINSNAHINLNIKQEACFLGLAPTTSTTLTLALGDALAMVMLREKGFTKEDFARSHPGGALGKKLTLKVEDIMHCESELPIVNEDETLANTLLEITHKRLGMVGICKDKKLIGIFTDGDLRRAIANKMDLNKTKIKDLMNTKMVVAKEKELAANVFKTLKEKSINGLFVVNSKYEVKGAINMHDLIKLF